MRKIRKLLLGASAVLSLACIATACGCGIVGGNGSSVEESVSNAKPEAGGNSSVGTTGDSGVGTETHEHKYDGKVEVLVEAKCYQNGQEKRYCSVEGCEAYEVVSTPKANCTYTTVEQIDPTCEDTGWTSYKYCEICSGYENDYMGEEISALGHDYRGATCFRCGERDWTYFSEGLEYTLSDDGSYYAVTDIGTCEDIYVVIPSIYNDLPVASIGDDAFKRCIDLTNIELPDSVTSIGDYAFERCSSLTSIKIPDHVTSIGYMAFWNCSGLTSIEIPDGVTSIGDYAFWSCGSLTSIEVSENNANYKSIDGNLYSKDGTTLIQYAIGKETTSFTVPDTVTSIGEWAFYECSNLTSVFIGENVTSIEYQAFRGCSGLTSITFNGTMEEWNGISKGSGWKYEVPATEVVCTDGIVTL